MAAEVVVLERSINLLFDAISSEAYALPAKDCLKETKRKRNTS